MNARASKVEALIAVGEDGRISLRSPLVGYLRDGLPAGHVVQPADVIGQLDVLGTTHALVAPEGASGQVVTDLNALAGGAARSKTPLAYGDVFLVLDPNAVGHAHAGTRAAAREANTSTGLSLKAPSSGRYYGRPGPGKDAFVNVGDVVSVGQTVALLEVMKTFNRVLYGGKGLPERARVTRIVPAEESDVQSGSVLLELEPA